MSDPIILGAATQQNLLSLQQINQSLATTQGHLATGLKVGSAVDNAVLFFQAQSLTNRSTDLSTRKDTIDQGVSSLTTGTQGIQSAISILQQLQGILQSAKTQTATQRASAATQFNTLSVQLNQLLNDSSYQGLNLVNSKTTSLTLQFSDASTSTLKVGGQNLLVSALLAGHAYESFNGFSGGSNHSKGSTYSVFAQASAGATFGHSKNSGFSAGQAAGTITLSGGKTIKASQAGNYKVIAWTGATNVANGHSVGSKHSAFTLAAYNPNAAGSGHSAGSTYSTRQIGANVKASVAATAFAGVKFSQAVSTGKTSAFDTVYNALNGAIATAQAAAQSLGSNVSLLQTRLSFTASYITTLSGGASKLTVADVNQESTNLVTLQTRQSLAIQSLSIATSSEQAVLRLFH
jgi:flagellin-like hook-associated protein FlgL